MAKYIVYGVVDARKYIGEFEADSPEDAEEMAREAVDSGDVRIELCHRCLGEVEEATIEEVIVYEED